MRRALSHPDLIPVAVAFAAGALLAGIDLGTRSIWLDEGSTIAIVSQHGAALWRAMAHDGGNMLLYYLGMHVLVAWFGEATWLLRLPSALATALTGGLVAALALRLFPGNRRLAAAAGLLVVVSLPLVYWGQNARGYAWMVTLATGSFLGLLAILQTPGDRAPSRRAISAYALTTLASLYVGYDAALLIPAQLALLLLAHRERARLVLGCLALDALLSLPLLVLAAQRGSGQLFWVTPLSWRLSGQATLALLSVALLPNFHRTATTVPATVLMGIALFGAIALAGRAARGRGSDGGAAGPLRFVLAWALVPTALTLLAYRLGEPIELVRVTILELPPVALLIAWVCLRREARPALGVAAIIVLLGLRAAQLIPAYGVSSEPWNAATAYVLQSTSASRPACVVFYAQDGREAVDYYLQRTAHPVGSDPAPALRPVLPAVPWTTVRPFVERYASLDPGQRARIVHDCPRLWLIGSHTGQRKGTHRSLVNQRRYERLEAALRRRYPHTTLRTFGWAAPIHVRELFR
ncbi:MAG TPA: hypothetical protein VFN36_06380 [Solirubrobacteraceae bacterium]|nr:hypothetical protein [Solirubrobacteraceae bacterium]